jgi:hypothetical protein
MSSNRLGQWIRSGRVTRVVFDEVEMIQSASSVLPASNPIAGLLSSASDVALDIMEVGELQIQLARLDAKVAIDRSIAAAVLVIGGGVMTAACLPLIAMGVANCIADQLAWEPWQAQLLVGVLSTCLALLLTTLGAYRLRYALTAFSITSSELAKNVSWLKQLVRGLKSTL